MSSAAFHTPTTAPSRRRGAAGSERVFAEAICPRHTRGVTDADLAAAQARRDVDGCIVECIRLIIRGGSAAPARDSSGLPLHANVASLISGPTTRPDQVVSGGCRGKLRGHRPPTQHTIIASVALPGRYYSPGFCPLGLQRKRPLEVRLRAFCESATRLGCGRVFTSYFYQSRPPVGRHCPRPPQSDAARRRWA